MLNCEEKTIPINVNKLYKYVEKSTRVIRKRKLISTDILKDDFNYLNTVSYTHLDVYKRQLGKHE